MGRLITTRQVQRRLGISRKTVDNWVKSGRLPPPVIKTGWRRWDEDDLRKAIDEERKES